MGCLVVVTEVGSNQLAMTDEMWLRRRGKVGGGRDWTLCAPLVGRIFDPRIVVGLWVPPCQRACPLWLGLETALSTLVWWVACGLDGASYNTELGVLWEAPTDCPHPGVGPARCRQLLCALWWGSNTRSLH